MLNEGTFSSGSNLLLVGDVKAALDVCLEHNLHKCDQSDQWIRSGYLHVIFSQKLYRTAIIEATLRDQEN